jgi:hypothetical protein
MIEFSLSRSREKLLPEAIEVFGQRIPVDADFRTVLKCIRVLSDPDMEERQKHVLLHAWFFRDFQGFAMPDEMRMSLFAAFLHEEDEADTGGDPAPADYEQDADAIYASFLQQYGIDLLDVPFLHWRKFTALMGCLGDDTPFGRRVALREYDASKIKDIGERTKIERAQRRVALREKALSREEKETKCALDMALEEDDSDAVIEILKRLRGGNDGG